VTFAQRGTSVELDHRVAYESVDVDGGLVGPSDAGVGAKGEVDRALCFLVLEDRAGDCGPGIRADPELRDRSSTRAAGVECREQPLGCRSFSCGDCLSLFELDRDRLVEESPTVERALEDDRSSGFALER
jgi:hypothetical protein